MVLCAAAKNDPELKKKIRTIVDSEKPIHTWYTLHTNFSVPPTMKPMIIGTQSRIGYCYVA